MLRFAYDARSSLTALDHARTAFALGVALVASPGPVRVPILSGSVKDGLGRVAA